MIPFLCNPTYLMWNYSHTIPVMHMWRELYEIH